MLRLILVTWAKVLAAYPAIVGIFCGLMEAGKGTGFAEKQPEHFGALVGLINWLLWFAIEHWLLLLPITLCIALFWVFVVELPRQESKAAFRKDISLKLPKKED